MPVVDVVEVVAAMGVVVVVKQPISTANKVVEFSRVLRELADAVLCVGHSSTAASLLVVAGVVAASSLRCHSTTTERVSVLLSFL